MKAFMIKAGTITVAGLAFATSCAPAAADPAQETSSEVTTISLPADANTTCPVMPLEPSDPDIYVDHKGRRVYLCCASCRRSFTKDPEKYLKLLPIETPATDSTESSTPRIRAESGFTSGGNALSDASTPDAESQIRDVGTEYRSDVNAQVESSAASLPVPPPPQLSHSQRLLRFSGRLHAVTVHFPIGLLLGAAAVEFVKVVRRRPVGSEGARVPLALGTAGALAAVPLGWVNAAFRPASGLEHLMEWHRWLGTAAGGFALAAWLLSRRIRPGRTGSTTAYLATLFTGTLLLILAGHFGAALIYGPDYLKP